MNQKVKKNLIASIILIAVFSTGFFTGNDYGLIVALLADSLLILYVYYLINYQVNLNKEKAQKSK